VNLEVKKEENSHYNVYLLTGARIVPLKNRTFMSISARSNGLPYKVSINQK